MSDSGEKPFEATPARVQKARSEGNVARAGELGANAAFAGAIAGALGCTAPIVSNASEAIEGAASGRVPLSSVAAIVLWTMLPLAAAALGAVAGGALQTGGALFVAPSLKFERIAPWEGLKRMCSRETLAQFARASAAFTIACAATCPLLLLASSSALARAGSLPAVAATFSRASIQIALAALGTGVAFAVAEFASARKSWLSKLRMTLDERRREMKEQEGDPATRGRRRSLHRSLVRGAISNVKSAAFVVANPTHVAVALEYRPPKVAVPRVLVRALDGAALRVRAMAAELKIPVIEDVALARELYAKTRAGDFIPVEHYVAVAAIVARLA